MRSYQFLSRSRNTQLFWIPKYPLALIKRASIVLSVNTNLIQKFSHYKLDWSVYTCLTQLYGGIYMYNLLHKEQLHVSALFIGHLQVDKWNT